jgi:Bacterial SH3 domain
MALALTVSLAGCGLFGGSDGHTSRQSSPTVKSTAAPTTTAPGVQTSGPRTVLSPVGLHVRAAPSLGGRVLGTAGQGTVLEVLGRTNQGGGWYRVKGETVTGWISANPGLSAPGSFRGFTAVAHHFQALFPTTWSVVESPANVIFRSPKGSETIVVTTAPSFARLGPVRAGYQQIRSETIVACGVTGDLVTSSVPGTAGHPAPLPYFARIRLALDRTHALGITAGFKALPELQSVRDFANSISFPFPECQG